jgi:hypothetical protein
VGETEQKIHPIAWPAMRGVTIKAHKSNAGNVLCGSQNNAAAGFVLAAGESIHVEVDNSDGVRIIADAPDQSYSWAVL